MIIKRNILSNSLKSIILGVGEEMFPEARVWRACTKGLVYTLLSFHLDTLNFMSGLIQVFRKHIIYF